MKVTPGRKSSPDCGELMGSCVIGHSSSARGSLRATVAHLESSRDPSDFHVMFSTFARGVVSCPGAVSVCILTLHVSVLKSGGTCGP